MRDTAPVGDPNLHVVAPLLFLLGSQEDLEEIRGMLWCLLDGGGGIGFSVNSEAIHSQAET